MLVIALIILAFIGFRPALALDDSDKPGAAYARRLPA
jgi:hypothetical protein